MINPFGTLSLEILLQMIFQEYLLHSRCLTFVTETALESNIAIIPCTYIKIENDTNLQDHILQVSEMGCSDYIIQTTKPKEFLTAFEEVNHIAIVRRSDRKLIFLPTFEEDDNNDLLSILVSKESYYVANILLVLEANSSSTECEIYDLVTHKFEGITEVNSPVYLDQWNSCNMSFEKNANLFPHDMTNMRGRKLKVAAFTYKPYALLDLNDAPHGRDGTEIRIVEEFCR